jgi:hypothetical protein
MHNQPDISMIKDSGLPLKQSQLQKKTQILSLSPLILKHVWQVKILGVLMALAMAVRQFTCTKWKYHSDLHHDFKVLRRLSYQAGAHMNVVFLAMVALQN